MQQLDLHAFLLAVSVQSSVDLTAAAARLRNQLLEVALTLPSLLRKGPELSAALHRYEMYWLPLLAEETQAADSDNTSSSINSLTPTTLAPPLDVQWVWQCHMLSPTLYASDTQRVFGRLLDHALLDVEERVRAQRRGRVAWEERYPGVPFELEGANLFEVVRFKSKFEYDIKGAALRQADFIYQVALPHYADTHTFLPSAVTRYHQFCYLHSLHPTICLVPAFDIDLVWHAHMMHPMEYARETTMWGGRVFGHDDTMNDRRQGSKLDLAAEDSRKLWTSYFWDAYDVNGSMLRGSPCGYANEAVQRDKFLMPDGTLGLKVITREFTPCNLQDIFAVEHNASPDTLGMPCDPLALTHPVEGHAATHTVCDTYGQPIFTVQARHHHLSTNTPKRN
eukprot:jgi/Chlat1/799/Chrsp104S01261